MAFQCICVEVITKMKIIIGRRSGRGEEKVLQTVRIYKHDSEAWCEQIIEEKTNKPNMKHGFIRGERWVPDETRKYYAIPRHLE